MDTARRARKWPESGGDHGRMAAAPGGFAAGLVARDHLDKRFAALEARVTWRIIGLLGVQIVMFSLITKYL